jgi:asparagine synthase (glutamine-hydrolysing)
MSGIVGIIHWHDSPVDGRLLQRMTEALTFRGPDRQGVWVDGSVGLGHAGLETTGNPAPEHHPYSLDGRVWITADARVDGRADLVRELKACGAREPDAENDAGLILHAYRVWGEACTQHILGDFAFAIWDGPRRRVFCARDHFGVKPFFYAQVADGLVFSNTLDCLRLHPGVSSGFNDQAIRDFLIFGGNQDPSTTCFADIRRLAPGHCLTMDAAGERRPSARRYWARPTGDPIRYRRTSDYVEHFRDLLERAVTDRLRCRRVGVLMSGGLDSTSIAATAKRCLSRQSSGFDLRAYTTVCERLLPDPEGRYARLAAEALAIPIHYRVVDQYQVYERWDTEQLRRPEPESDPLLALHVDQLQDAADKSQVVLTGFGADPVFRVPIRYAVELLTRGDVPRLAREIGQYVVACHRLPRVRIGSHVKTWLGFGKRSSPSHPPWLNPDFAARSDARAGAARVDLEPAPDHPSRREAYSLLTSPDWPLTFESYDPGVTGVPVEVRHPFFDLRLVTYLLAIPPMPWCFDKTILRLAMRGALPESVRLRAKTVAVGDPLVALLRQPAARWVDRFEPVAALRASVNRDRIPRVCGEADSSNIWTNLRPLCLNYWLRSQETPESRVGRTA